MKKRGGGLLKTAGELRDGFLVMAGICYFFGYIVWAITAYNNNLGLLPALDFQYFVAGAPLVLVIIGLCYVVLGGLCLRRWVRRRIGPNPEGWKLYLCVAMACLGIIAYFLILANTADWFQAAFPNLARSSWFVLGLTLIVIASSILSPELGRAPKRQDVSTEKERVEGRAAFLEAVRNLHRSLTGLLWIAGWLFAFMVLLIVAVLAFLFVVESYPKIPQEFGGARPQCAYLDVDKAKISSETIQGILPTGASQADEPVVRSLGVEVLFSGGDVMMIRSQGRVYKIAKDAIQTVATCN